MNTRRYDDEEAESTRRKNLEKKKLRCLGCGREIYTDRCHRFCKVCQRRNKRNRYHLPKTGRISECNTQSLEHLSGCLEDYCEEGGQEDGTECYCLNVRKRRGSIARKF